MNRDQLLHERKRLKAERRKVLGMGWLFRVRDAQITASARFAEISLRSSYQRRRGR